MSKSGDCDSDGSISWEDFFGSSSDLVPTLLRMYDTLIAETLADDQNPKQRIGSATTVQSQTIAESLQRDLSEGKAIANPPHEANCNLLKTNSMNTATSVVEPKATDSPTAMPNGHNVPVRTLETLPIKNGNSVTPQHQYKLGLLSRSFSKWSSRITDKSVSRTPPLENGKSKGSQRKATVVVASPAIQRPLSVNSTFSSTSTSSCSSESSASLSTANGIISGERKAPKASPEEEDDIVPAADMSDEEEPGGKGASSGQNQGAERCFSTSTPKDCGNSGRTRISYPMSTQGKPKFYDPNLTYMDRVVMEIVETERVYVTDLQEIISSYLGHWKSCQEDEKPTELEDITELFSNIEEIHTFNSDFVTQLEGCGLDPVQVAKCFVTQNEGFSVYTQYCTHYPRTMFILTEMMRKEKSAKYFRERQATLGHSLPLGSYLLKPVQRILKYHLLLQNIVKHYDGEEEGYSAIVEALSAMTNIAHHINDMKRRHEHAVRVQEIQSLLYGWQGEDLTTYGELYAEGTFRVYGAKALRHVFLFDKMLLITKKKEDGILSYKSHIMCSNLMLIESVPGELLSFHVIPFDNPRLQCTLQAKNGEQKREWTLQLKRVILENYHAVIPTHAYQLVMELGQCRPEADGSFLSEKVQTTRQHSAPEYLERRKQEKDRRKAESTLKAKLRRARKNDPINPKEGLIAGRRSNSRRTSLDSNISTAPDRGEQPDDLLRTNGIIDRKMSISSCPVEASERLLVKKLGGWRRKSEPEFYLNGLKGSGKVSNGLTSPPHGNSQLTIDFVESIGEETDGGEVDEADSTGRQLPEDNPSPNVEQRRESVEEIVGQLVMQNREIQRILSKRRMVHLRRASTQSHQRRQQEEDESGSDAETEDSLGTPMKKSAASSSSNGIGSSSDVNGDSRENISTQSKDNDQEVIHSKNVQRTVSDPGNKSTLTPRRFISGPFSHYDPISLLWSSFRRNDSNRRSNTSNTSTKASEINDIKSSNAKPSIRHTHSFTCSRKDPYQSSSPTESKATETGLPHGDSGVFPNSFTSDSSSSSEANIPTLPAVWLKQQHEHLATPSTKSGSLPRSFQVGQHQPSPPPQMAADNNLRRAESPGGVKSRLRDSGKYPIPERPFTIASDKPSPSDMSYDEMEQYMSKFNEHMTRCAISEDIDQLTASELTPITSMDNLSLHPDHKIYHRSSKSSSIKHILLSVTHRLSGIKANRTSTTVKGAQAATVTPTTTAGNKTPINFGSYPNISLPSANGSLDKAKKTLKQKIKDQVVKEDSDSENCESITSSGFGSLGSSGSSTNNLNNSKKIGARLAQCCEPSDYALSKLQQSPFDDHNRPQSVMSASSSSTSDDHFTQELCPGVFLRKNCGGKRITHRDLYLSYIDQDGDEIDGSLSDSDGSADSFYERSFEAIENFFESEIFPDSAIYSDQDEQSTTATPKLPESSGSGDKESLAERWNSLQLPIGGNAVQNGESSRRSRVICSQAILEKLKHLEQCTQFQRDCLPSPSFEGIKSIQQRRKELELWKTRREDESETSSQHSTSTINTVIELSPSKSTSFPSSRRCSDTESTSGGNSPLTERAVSRSSARSHSQGHLCSNSSDNSGKSKGWVKLVVGKLQGEGDS